MAEENRIGVGAADEEQEDFEVRERKRLLFFGLPFTFTTYTLRPKKLTVSAGLFTTVEDDILLYRIKDTSLKRTLWQKLFRLGSIAVASSDHSIPELVIKNIRNVREFKELLDEQVEKERIRMRFRAGEFMDTESEGCDEEYHQFGSADTEEP